MTGKTWLIGIVLTISMIVLVVEATSKMVNGYVSEKPRTIMSSEQMSSIEKPPAIATTDDLWPDEHQLSSKSESLVMESDALSSKSGSKLREFSTFCLMVEVTTHDPQSADYAWEKTNQLCTMIKSIPSVSAARRMEIRALSSDGKWIEIK